MSDGPSFETVLADIDGPIGTLTLNRPDNANTFNQQLGRDVVEAAEFLRSQRCRVIVVTGAGRHFCAGADLKAIGAGEGPRLGDTSFIDIFEELRLPVVASINGSAVGGGCELALACDLRIMSTDAKIGLPEVKFGGLAAGGGTQRLPRLVGPGIAKQLLMLGELLDAQEALRIGLVNWAVAPDELPTFTRKIAETLAERAPYAVESAKFLVNRATDVDLRTGIAMETYVARRMATGAQRKEAQSGAASGGGAYKKIFEGSDGV
jgi:enoyl-CoA hydratase/carnithine racemase